MGFGSRSFHTRTRSGRAYSSCSGSLVSVLFIIILIAAVSNALKLDGIYGGSQSDYKGLEYTAAEKKLSSWLWL